jgi:hypothetical protein
VLLGGLIYDAAVVVAIAVYWIPTLAAAFRRSEKATVVFIVNLLLGWTVIGWIVALTIALGSEARPRT